ncbi:MAG: rRNA maturation RNase YbeY [Chloroflexi bacterium]|nr:rRNA maturation RNase YbeY [Chloroflexota bacterium]
MSRPPPEPSVLVVVEFSVEKGLAAQWDEPRLTALVRSIFSTDLAPESARFVIGLHLVGDATIRALNAEHRGLDAHTDVLSFPLLDRDEMDFVVPPGQATQLGDVVVSHPRAVEQALEFGHSTDREIGYLVAHGVLHILGYDHEAEPERSRMRQREEEALAPLGFIR